MKILILDEQILKRLKKFALEIPSDEEIQFCDTCIINETGSNTWTHTERSCRDCDICDRYSNNDKTLVKDLFETIEHFQNQIKCKSNE